METAYISDQEICGVNIWTALGAAIFVGSCMKFVKDYGFRINSWINHTLHISVKLISTAPNEGVTSGKGDSLLDSGNLENSEVVDRFGGLETSLSAVVNSFIVPPVSVCEFSKFGENLELRSVCYSTTTKAVFDSLRSSVTSLASTTTNTYTKSFSDLPLSSRGIGRNPIISKPSPTTSQLPDTPDPAQSLTTILSPSILSPTPTPFAEPMISTLPNHSTFFTNPTFPIIKPESETDVLQMWILAAMLGVLLIRGYYLLFVTPTKLFFSERVCGVDVYDSESKKVVQKNLIDLITEKCPLISDPIKSKFHFTPWLFNGHLQTFWAAVIARRKYDNRVKYERELLYLPDGGNIALDWCPAPGNESLPDDSPCIIILHGLTGGSHETYVQDLVETLVHPSHTITKTGLHNRRNYRTVVVNFRGCAGTKLTSPRLYNGASTYDIREAVKYVRERVTGAALSAVGFSLGANILVKFVGECGKNCPLITAVAVGSPFELYLSNRALHRSWLGRTAYSYVIARNLVHTFNKHKEQLLEIEGLEDHEIVKAQTVTDFDAAATAKAFGYRHVNEYYRDGCSSAYIPDITIPTLLYSSYDDPVAHNEAIPYTETKANPNIMLAVTAKGGHLGWFSGWWEPRRVYQHAVAEFLECVIEAHMSLPENIRKQKLNAIKDVSAEPEKQPSPNRSRSETEFSDREITVNLTTTTTIEKPQPEETGDGKIKIPSITFWRKIAPKIAVKMVEIVVAVLVGYLMGRPVSLDVLRSVGGSILWRRKGRITL
ncbi:hypothetical protein HK098_006096 [Nowakowskiella sp. JEL0407]|nr:hypothetical protein HK098_006096 [Nowakowskiella sp. JEL0407]